MDEAKTSAGTGIPRRVAEYTFSITALEYPGGRLYYRTNNENHGIHLELIIAHLQAILRRWKEEFYTDFDQRTMGIKKE
ncbi:MAG: hypothetical protein AABX70_07450 [Nanoarchaeota archaeon]